MKKLTSIFFTALLSICAFSEPVIKVHAPGLVSEEEQFNVTFIVDGEQSVSDFQWETGSDFRLVWGPQKGSSTSISIINGKKTTSAQTTYTYILMPNSAGKFTIPAATAVVGKTSVTSKAVQIEVVAGTSSARSSAQDDGRQEETFRVPDSVDGDIFLSLTFSKTRVVVGETVTATLKLYQRANIAGFEDVHFPTFDGFWSQETQVPQNVEFHREKVNGTIYDAALLRAWSLVPQRSGEIKVDPAELVCLVNVRAPRASTGSIFDAFFQDEYRTVRKRVSTSAATIHVSDLPSPAPGSFGGGVGEFKMNASLSRDSLLTHDAASLVIRIAGSGNVSMLEAPKVNFPPDFDTYDVKVSDIPGGKSFEYTFIPRSYGDFTIQPVQYSYYSVRDGKYITLESAALGISVGKSADYDTSAPSDAVSRGVSRKDVENLGTDIRYIHTSTPRLKPAGKMFAGSSAFWQIMAALLAVAGIFCAVKRKLDSRRSDVVGSKNRAATKMALKRLSLASSYLSSNVHSAFYEELHKALLGFASDKLNLDVSDSGKESIGGRLSACGVSERTVAQYVELIDACEYARYSPDTSSDQMKKHYDSALNLISEMDTVFRKKRPSAGAAVLLAVLMISPAAASAAESGDSLWDKGVEAYSDGRWSDASECWETLAGSGMVSSDLYYNIGNAKFKQGDIAHSIIAYERALKLDPSNRDARFNLEFVKGFVRDRIEVVPEFFLKTWVGNLCYLMSSNVWSVLCLVLFASFLALLVLFLSSSSPVHRKVGFFTGLAAFLLSAVTLSFAISQKADSVDDTRAVVVSSVAGVKSSPDDNLSTDLFILHEGTEVNRLEGIGNWTGIELDDGRKGWIKNSDIEII